MACMKITRDRHKGNKLNALTFISICTLASLGVQARAATENRCSIKSADYFGWKSQKISNGWVELTIVPQLGGRLMQVTFSGHDFLFVNEQLKGKYFPPDQETHRWFNYGGDKVWPMPEGSKDEQHWPGAGGSLLDDAPYDFEVLSHNNVCSIRLTGPVDSFTGLQYIRDISIDSDSPVISFHSVMKNKSAYPRSWSQQSVSQYNTAASDDPSKTNPDIWGITPANPSSSFLNGFHVRTGQMSESAYTVEDGLFKVHPFNSSGEVWIDSPAGWLAVTDAASHFTMVERARYQTGANYPDKTTMIFYTTGQRNHASNNPSDPPPAPIHYMEAEVNSPVVELAPDESYAMDTQWYPTRNTDPLQSATYAGTIEVPLAAKKEANALSLSGKFGVFYPGTLMAFFYGQGGEPLGSSKVADVSPAEPLKLSTTINVPEPARRVSLHIFDRHNMDRGSLGEAFIQIP
jgi:hypothetical protein